MANKSSKLEIQVDAETKSAVKDLDKVAAAVDDISSSAAEAGSALDSIASGAADAAGAAGDSFGGIVPVFDVTAVLGAVGDLASKAGEFFSDQLSKAMDFDVGQDKLQGQLGATAEEAEHLGQLAGDLYSEAFGESMEQVNDVMRRVIQNLGTDVMDPALKGLTSGVLDIVNTFEQDAAKTTQALGNLVKTGLVKDAGEGLDLMVRGFQKGADNADDFADSLIEFSTDFRQAGLTGAQSVGLMIQALKNGARDTDKLSDALAEWRKKGVDGSKGVADAYKDLGLDVKEISRDIGKGGADAADALKRTFDAIRNLEDPGEKLRLIAETFGTPAEDLAQAFTNIDLSKAVEELGTVQGAAKELSTTVADNADATWTAFKRSLETNVVQFLADNVVPAFQDLGTKASAALADLGHAWDSFVQGFQGQKPLELGIDDGHLTDSIGAVEAANRGEMENPTLKTFRELGEEARKLTDEWGPKVVTTFEDIRKKLDELALWFQQNREMIDLLIKIGFVGILVVGALVVIQLGIIAAALALLGLAFGIPVAGIVLLIDWFNRLDEKWKTFFGAIVGVAEGPLEQVGSMIGTIIEIIENLATGVLAAARGDWSTAWNSMWDTVKTIGGFITQTIENITGKIRDLINAIKGVASEGSMGTGTVNGPIGPRSLSGLMVAPMAAAPAVAPAPVFNISVQHSGLAVDSPRLQREIVDAIRRYEKREGLIRNPNALAAR